MNEEFRSPDSSELFLSEEAQVQDSQEINEESLPREKKSLETRLREMKADRALRKSRKSREESLKKRSYMSFTGHSSLPIFITEDKKDEYRSMRRLGYVRITLAAVAVILLVTAGVVFALDNRAPAVEEGEGITNPELTAPVVLPRDDFEPISYDSDTGLAVYNDDFNLFTVNERNPLPENYLIKTETYMGVQVDEKIVSALSLMVNDIQAADIKISFERGYISYEDQLKLYNEEVERLKKDDETHLMAQYKAAENVDVAGESDYHTGLSVKIKSGRDFTRTKLYKWLSANAADYGFIFRYPEGKDAYTGGEDLTVIRYVGRTNAIRMRQLSMCLEEYTDYLGSR